ncbi:MAG: glycosyltransferase [Candidatus Latescibacteria bacterium]|nr:glycosyltransferase [Candidatus Latescibacterota bacterium]
MRILHVSPSDMLIGGARGSAWDVFRACRAHGHQSWLAVGHKQSDDPDVLLIPNDACRSRWTRRCLAVRASLQPFVGGVRGVRRLSNLLPWISEPRRQLEDRLGYEDFTFPGTWRLLHLPPVLPDIVHCHNLHGGGYFDLRALPWLSHQVPVILNLHSAWLLSGHCSHSFDCERWKIGCGRCPDLSIHPSIKRDGTAHNWRRKRAIYEKSRFYITTPSQWLMEKVRASMLRGVHYRVIPNGIDLTVFRPGDQIEARSALGLPVRAKVILLIAHNIFKDYGTMETALRRVEKSEDTELVFVCLGKTGVDKVVGQGRMVYRGFEYDKERMVLYYRAADVFIHAAIADTFPSTILEARACGVPVVATAVGGIPEQIDDGTTGFLVPPGDSSSMAGAVERLLTDSALHVSIRQAGLADTRRRFGLDRQVDAFLEWYQEILGLK